VVLFPRYLDIRWWCALIAVGVLVVATTTTTTTTTTIGAKWWVIRLEYLIELTLSLRIGMRRCRRRPPPPHTTATPATTTATTAATTTRNPIYRPIPQGKPASQPLLYQP